MPVPLELLRNFIRDGLILARICAGADDEMIGETGDAGQVQHSNVFRLLFLCCPYGDPPSGLCFLLRTGTSVLL